MNVHHWLAFVDCIFLRAFSNLDGFGPMMFLNDSGSAGLIGMIFLKWSYLEICVD